MPTLISRFRGALLGLACGDALGTTNEFEDRDTFPPLTDMVGGGRFRLEPGQWTDDTSMAMCLAESLVERGGFDAADQMERYLRWWKSGYWSSTGRCFDIGGTVNSALARFERTRDPWSGPSDPNTAGNGSLMRLAPVVLFFGSDVREAAKMAAESSRTTHGALEAVDACRYFGVVLAGALAGGPKEQILSSTYSEVSGLGGTLSPRIAAIAAGSFRSKRVPKPGENFDGMRHVCNSGYVVDTLEAALWAFSHHDDFRSGALAAANLGGDADTIAAVYGQLAGAYYGEEGIPPEWLGRLARREDIAGLAERLLQASSMAA
jgi:ADP-ribosyl-[dinitrogen reductase] hydrolase